MQKFSIQTLDSDCSVCMAAICYSGPISAVPTNEQLRGKKKTCSKFQIDISKTEDGQTDIAKSTQLVTVIIYKYLSILYMVSAAYFWMLQTSWQN